jgi:ribosome biogenesis SPOUT family RNA methylase Rps3
MNGRAKEIELGKTRYLNKEFNISIIEIKEKKIKNINFIELDDILYENEPEMFFQKKSIYVIQYDTKKEILVSYGMLNNLNKDKIRYSFEKNIGFYMVI